MSSVVTQMQFESETYLVDTGKDGKMYQGRASTTHNGLQDSWARTYLLLGSLFCLSVSGCKTAQPSLSADFHDPPVAGVIDCWSHSGSIELTANQSGGGVVSQVGHVVDTSTVSLVSHADSHSIVNPQTQDWCPSCQPSCSTSWCMPTKLCCLDNPCQMPPHYAYSPSNHGYTQFAPYNHSTVLLHQEITRHHNNDPRQPYRSDVFKKAYARVVGGREEGHGEEVFDAPAGLPNLIDIIGS